MFLSFQLDREKEQVNNQLKRNISLKFLVMVYCYTFNLLLSRYVSLSLYVCSSSDGVSVGGEV